MGVMNTIELTGVSADGWGEAAREALREAGKTIRRINKLEVIDSEAVIADGKITEYHTRVRIFFDIE